MIRVAERPCATPASWVDRSHVSPPNAGAVKPAIGGIDDFDLNEHPCLAAARRAGLIAATTSIRTFGVSHA
jgi:serine/threonine-protein kinase HipA